MKKSRNELKLIRALRDLGLALTTLLFLASVTCFVLGIVFQDGAVLGNLGWLGSVLTILMGVGTWIAWYWTIELSSKLIYKQAEEYWDLYREERKTSARLLDGWSLANKEAALFRAELKPISTDAAGLFDAWWNDIYQEIKKGTKS